jgi:hypothetical protein
VGLHLLGRIVMAPVAQVAAREMGLLQLHLLLVERVEQEIRETITDTARPVRTVRLARQAAKG